MNVWLVLEKAGTPPKVIFQTQQGAEDYIEANGGKEKYYIEAWAAWRSYGDLQHVQNTIVKRGEL